MSVSKDSEFIGYPDDMQRSHMDALDWTKVAPSVGRIRPMKTLTERIAEYAERKGITVLQAHETLLAFALDTLDGRRKGAQTINARPEHAKHLARARKIRAK